MGGLPYLTPLRITWGGHSAIAYKRDIGFGGGPIDGLPRVIDLWWELAGRLGIPYEDGLWSGPVRIERPPDNRRRQRPRSGRPRRSAGADRAAGRRSRTRPRARRRRSTACPRRSRRADHPRRPRPAAAERPRRRARRRAARGQGDHRRRQPDRRQAVHCTAAATACRCPRSRPTYDCSSSVEHLLYGAGLLPGRLRRRRRGRSSRSARPGRGSGSRCTRTPTTCSCTSPGCAGTRTTPPGPATGAPGSAGIR